MGTWGSGNLECDGALDEVGERSSALIKQLWERAQNQESWEADEWMHDALFVDFEMLFALENAKLFNGWDLPKPTDVEPARTKWMAGWTSYYEGMGATEEFAAERRSVIEATWQRFMDICAKYAAQRDS